MEIEHKDFTQLRQKLLEKQHILQEREKQLETGKIELKRKESELEQSRKQWEEDDVELLRKQAKLKEDQANCAQEKVSIGEQKQRITDQLRDIKELEEKNSSLEKNLIERTKDLEKIKYQCDTQRRELEFEIKKQEDAWLEANERLEEAKEAQQKAIGLREEVISAFSVFWTHIIILFRKEQVLISRILNYFEDQDSSFIPNFVRKEIERYLKESEDPHAKEREDMLGLVRVFTNKEGTTGLRATMTQAQQLAAINPDCVPTYPTPGYQIPDHKLDKGIESPGGQ